MPPFRLAFLGVDHPHGAGWREVLPLLGPDVELTALVPAFGGRVASCPVEDGGTVVLELEGGALVTFTGGYWLPRWATETAWTLRGSERWVHWDAIRAGTGGVLCIHGPQPQFHAMEETYTLPADDTAGYGGARSIRLIGDWIAAARTGVNRCRSSAASVLQTLRLLDLVYQSSVEGRRLACHLPPVPPSA